MGETRRQFSREYKLEAVRLITEVRRPPGEVARELGVRADMLRRWKREVEMGTLLLRCFRGTAMGLDQRRSCAGFGGKTRCSGRSVRS